MTFTRSIACLGLSVAALLELLHFEGHAAPNPVPCTVAVFEFDVGDDISKSAGKDVAAIINAKLSTNENLWLVERAELEKVLNEQALVPAGLATPDTAAKLGNLTGAKVLVTGRIFKAGSESVAIAKVMGTETSRVFSGLAKGTGGSASVDCGESLATTIANLINQNRNALLPPPNSAADKLEKVKTEIPQGNRPTISVRLPEQHFGHPAVDPAAETEIARIAKELGCTLLEPGKDLRADYEVTGEAFSEIGVRRAGLISARARAEVKVVHTKTGRIVAVDRETEVGIDVAEHVAAKNALQRAGFELAIRVMPQILRQSP